MNSSKKCVSKELFIKKKSWTEAFDMISYFKIELT